MTATQCFSEVCQVFLAKTRQ